MSTRGDTDDTYREAGPRVAAGEVLSDADVVLSVQPLSVEQAARLREGAVTISLRPAGQQLEL